VNYLNFITCKIPSKKHIVQDLAKTQQRKVKIIISHIIIHAKGLASMMPVYGKLGKYF